MILLFVGSRKNASTIHTVAVGPPEMARHPRLTIVPCREWFSTRSCVVLMRYIGPVPAPASSGVTKIVLTPKEIHRQYLSGFSWTMGMSDPGTSTVRTTGLPYSS